MKKSIHYFFTMLVPAIMLFSHAFVPVELSDNKAVIIEEISESRIIAEENKGDVDDLLTSHCPLPTKIYLSHAIILLQQSDISYFSLPFRVRAPPLV